MAPSRKISTGRSPLVNKQHQITSFFSKSSIKVNPDSSSKIPNLQNPNPKFADSPGSSPPTTPSPLNAKTRPKSMQKPVLVIGSGNKSENKGVLNTFGKEVLNRRIRIFWPLDKTWYEGYVKAYDKNLGKHLIEYDDADEELINLLGEKFEWIESEGSVGRNKFRRLRKASIVVEDDEDEEGNGKGVGVNVEDDDSSDEDWSKGVNVSGEEAKDDDCLEEMELVDEVEEENLMERLKRKRGQSGKESGEEPLDLSVKKKKKRDGFLVSEFGTKVEKVGPSVQGN